MNSHQFHEQKKNTNLLFYVHDHKKNQVISTTDFECFMLPIFYARPNTLSTFIIQKKNETVDIEVSVSNILSS